jgi:alcohol dehydrogenase
VRASSLNPIDFKLRSGVGRPILTLRFPAVLGFDLAGEVDAVGPGVTSPRVGERVYGRIDRLTGGAHAQFATVAARVLDRIPDRLSDVQAAALPLAGMSALQALQDLARLGRGQRLLVIGGAGGVGGFAVQIGRGLGATVTAVVSESGIPIARRLGASEIVDYTMGELERHDQRYDVVFDTVFKRPYSSCARFIERGGAYVTTGFSPGLAVRSLVSRLGIGPRVHWLVSRADGDLMRGLSALVAAGQVEPVIDSIYPLVRIQEAYARLEEGHVHGKIVLTIP